MTRWSVGWWRQRELRRVRIYFRCHRKKRIRSTEDPVIPDIALLVDGLLVAHFVCKSPKAMDAILFAIDQML